MTKFTHRDTKILGKGSHVLPKADRIGLPHVLPSEYVHGHRLQLFEPLSNIHCR